MRVFVSAPSEAAPSRRGAVVSPAIAAAVALAWLLAHLPFLAPSLEDIDSINFALGLHDFDPARHQPHPPGYPVYIVLGRAALWAIHAAAPAMAAVRADALALALWSAIAGAVALLAAASLFRSFDEQPGSQVANDSAAWPAALWATVLLGAAPLFWMTGLRPMSDMPGLAAALAAQALVVRGFRDRRALIVGVAVAGLAIGVRSQTFWLTAPLTLVALIEQRRAGAWWLLSRPVAAGAAACLAWAIPLLVASGGIDGYLAALSSQAGEDFAWVDMLWANPTPRRLAFTLYESFVLPWASLPLAILVLAASAVGAIALLLRARTALWIVLVAFAPYAIFHMLFQETVTVRYALPIVPALAYLATRGVSVAARATAPLAGALAAFALVVAVPGGIAYGREPHPAFRAIADMNRAAASARPAEVHAHFALRRPLQSAEVKGLPIVEPRPRYEWLGLEHYWRGGGRNALWFLADPKRTDLALIDPQSRGEVTRYRWAVGDRAELSGTRPTGVDWYRLTPPRWFAAEGWALTPETGGIAQDTGKGVDRQPIEAFVRREAAPAKVLIGTRFLDDGGATPVAWDLSIDGVAVEQWVTDPKAGANALRIVDLPGGIPGAPGYARLAIAARAAVAGQPMPRVAVRQFDLQPANGLLFGFGDGWHEAEYDNATGLRWRWTSDRSTIQVVPPQAIRLTLRGESPLRYVDAAPTVKISAGGQVAGTLQPADDFEWSITVPADAVARGGGAVIVETDRVYLPGPAEGTADARRLGLRLFDIRVERADR